MLWTAGTVGLIVAARFREIHLHSGDVAINDQWKIEAADILAPWLDGTLRLRSFFAPHFEHMPAWTRLAVWLEAVLTGRWDPLAQATVNTLLFAGYAALVVHWVARHLRTGAALAVSLLFVLGSVLPHAWENITWGFQSQFPFALLFLFLHVRGSMDHPIGTRAWWWAQAAGVAGLFTLAGMWIAPLAVVLVGLWTRVPASRLRFAPLGIVTLGLVIIAYIRATAPPYGAFAQTAGSPLHFLHALLDLLGWPAGWPGAVAVLNLPLAIFALQLRGRTDASAFDRTTLALGLWAVGQAAALAFARSADYGGYVSRYGELLAVLVLANSLALARIGPAVPRWRPLIAVAALGWTSVVVAGCWNLSTGGHTAYFHQHSAENARIRRDAVQAYLKNGDRTPLEQQATRWVLYQDVNQVTSLLDQPRFRALLPQAVNPDNPADFTGTLVRRLHSWWTALGALAGLAAVCGGWSLLRRPSDSAICPPFEVHADPLVTRVASVVSVAAFAGLFCWPAPFVFAREARWHEFFLPRGSVGPLEVQIQTGSASYAPERLIGAAPLSPPELCRQFSGTEPEGPGLTCTAWSKAFPINQPWFVIPHAGYPVAHGNGLRLRIEERDGRFITEVACEGPNPRAIAFWTADVRPFLGKQARLVLYDGRTETEAWVAAAPPIGTSDQSLGTRLGSGLALEHLSPAHTALAWISLVSAILAALTRFSEVRPTKKSP